MARCARDCEVRLTPTSFLRTPDETRALLEASGFEILVWQDNTAAALAEAETERARLAASPAARPVLGIHVVAGPGFSEKVRNSQRGKLVSENFYWRETTQDDLTALDSIPDAQLDGKIVRRDAGGNIVLELTLTNLPRHRVEDWLQGFRIQALPATNKSQLTRPREFRLSHIDELEPRNNRSYAVSTTSAKRLDDFLKTLPPAPIEQ